MRPLLAFALFGLVACEGTIDPIYPFRPITDAGAADGSTDGSVSDAEVRDAGDAAVDDAGPVTDGGDRDAGPAPDSGARDGGVDTLAACTTSIEVAIAAELAVAPGRGSEGYVPIPVPARARLRAAVEAALAGDDDTLAAAVDAAGYRVCRTQDAELLFTPATSAVGRGIAVIRPSAARRVILEAPHAVFETTTASVATILFDDLDAVGLLVGTTHRCANARGSGCSGTTQACSAQAAPYVESDMGHNVDAAFHVFHEALIDLVPTSTAVSLHGKGGNGAVISNGTQDDTTDDALVPRVIRALAAARPADSVLTCNRYPGGAIAGQLCGTTNVQGRYANGQTMACARDPDAATDRFVHLELSFAIRSDPDAVSGALDIALR